jgi:hypothetical protein
LFLTAKLDSLYAKKKNLHPANKHYFIPCKKQVANTLLEGVKQGLAIYPEGFARGKS